MAGQVGHVSLISDWCSVVVGCDLVGHGGTLGVGAEEGQNYSEAPDGEGLDQHRLLGLGIPEEGGESPGHLGLGSSLILNQVFGKSFWFHPFLSPRTMVMPMT